MSDKELTKLPIGSVRPSGWLMSQMVQMCNLHRRLGSLDGMMKGGRWTGGDALAKFVRGGVLLAAAMNDRSMFERLTGHVKFILSSANEGGDFGPKGMSQLAKIESVKAILSVYEYSKDERLMHFLKRYFKHQYDTLDLDPCWYTSRARLLDEMGAVSAAYDDCASEWLKDLAEKLRDCSNDWFRLGEKFAYRRPASKYLSQSKLKRIKKIVSSYDCAESESNPKLKPLTKDFVEKQWKKQLAAIELDGVSVAKAIKYAAVYGSFIGDENLKRLSKKMLSDLQLYHGTPLGMFTCDPYLAGNSATRGIDVEAAVETVESIVEVMRLTADMKLADSLERIVFNLLPAACFKDGSAVQDMICVNQAVASTFSSGSAKGDAELKKLFRRFPLMQSQTGNAYGVKRLSRGALAMLSAYPLYLGAACFKKGEELNFFTYMPCVIDVSVNGVRLVLSEKTGYPFRNSVIFKVEKASDEVEVKFRFRVPTGCTMQLISGGEVVASGNKDIEVKSTLKTGSTFTLKMDIPLSIEENRDGTVSMFKGNVLLSYKLPHDAYLVDGKTYKVVAIKKWNVAPVLSRRVIAKKRVLLESERTVVGEITDAPFNVDEPPFELKIRAKNVVNWEQVYKLGGRRPTFSEESIERSFVPFGCTLMHIAAFYKCVK